MAIWACAVAATAPKSSASAAVLKRDFMLIVTFLRSFVRGYVLVLPVPTSMRKRIEFPVGLDLPPAMREPVWLKHQKRDDDQADRNFAQEGDVVVERQRLVDRAAFQAGAD